MSVYRTIGPLVCYSFYKSISPQLQYGSLSWANNDMGYWIQQGHVEISFFIHLHLYFLLDLAKTGPVQSLAHVLVQTVYQCHLYWARHWPRPKLYAELGGMQGTVQSFHLFHSFFYGEFPFTFYKQKLNFPQLTGNMSLKFLIIFQFGCLPTVNNLHLQSHVTPHDIWCYSLCHTLSHTATLATHSQAGYMALRDQIQHYHCECKTCYPHGVTLEPDYWVRGDTMFATYVIFYKQLTWGTCIPTSSAYNFFLRNYWAIFKEILYVSFQVQGNENQWTWCWSHDQDGGHAYIW